RGDSAEGVGRALKPPALPAPPEQAASKTTNSQALAARIVGSVAVGQLPAQPGLDELVDLAVLEHRLHVALLDAGPDILDQRVGLERVVADRGAELGRRQRALQVIELFVDEMLVVIEWLRLMVAQRVLARLA